MKANKHVMTFALVAFTLLGVLFGVQIFAFMSGNLGQATEAILSSASYPANNETGAVINYSGYTLSKASLGGFANPSIGAARGELINSTNEPEGGVVPITAPNYTVSAAGVVTNATAAVWVNVELDYTYDAYSDVQLNVRAVNNNTLQGISTYSSQTGTQFTTVAIAITLVILIAVFLLFWQIFVGKKPIGRSSTGNFS